MKMRLGDLIRSDDLVKFRPRNCGAVTRYTRTLQRDGDVFPPFLVGDGKFKNLLIGGYHRYPAYERVYGLNYEVNVIFITCKTWKEVVEAFARDNTTHGLPFTSFQRKVLVAELTNLGTTVEDLAVLFHMPVTGVQTLQGKEKIRVVSVGQPDRYVPYKGGITVPGGTMTEAQYADHCAHELGSKTRHLAMVLAKRMENGFIDREDLQEATAVRRLRNAIDAAGYPVI